VVISIVLYIHCEDELMHSGDRDGCCKGLPRVCGTIAQTFFNRVRIQSRVVTKPRCGLDHHLNSVLGRYSKRYSSSSSDSSVVTSIRQAQVVHFTSSFGKPPRSSSERAHS